MALEHKDRVLDSSTTTGTGTLTLDGTAPTGYRTFASAHTNGATVRYVAYSGNNAEWEVGEGVYNAGTLTRATVFASSNSGAFVNFTLPVSVASTMTAADAGSVTGIIDKIKIYRNGTGVNSVATGDQKVPLNLVDYDTNSLWDSVNTRIVPKKPGYYQWTARLRRDASGIFIPHIRKNGASQGNSGPDITASGTFGSGIVYCNGTTDYLECGCYATSTAAWSTFDNWMTVIGPL